MITDQLDHKKCTSLFKAYVEDFSSSSLVSPGYKLYAQKVHLIISVSLKSSYLVYSPSDIINWKLGELKKPLGTLAFSLSLRLRRK